MLLQGSCHCRAVTFSLEANSPVPFMHCHCSICRKTAGSGGFAINLGGNAHSLKVAGREHLRVYHAVIREEGQPDERSVAERNFCGECGSALWLWDPRWPDLIHPFASAIDSDLPVPPQHVHMMLGSKANWVEPQLKKGDDKFDDYPEQSLEDWHRAHHLLEKV